jgi:hypothetical protein
MSIRRCSSAIDAKRRLTVPASLAPASPGDYFDASFDAEEDALMFRGSRVRRIGSLF